MPAIQAMTAMMWIALTHSRIIAPESLDDGFQRIEGEDPCHGAAQRAKAWVRRNLVSRSPIVAHPPHWSSPIKRIEKDSFFSFFGGQEGLQDSVHTPSPNRRPWPM